MARRPPAATAAVADDPPPPPAPAPGIGHNAPPRPLTPEQVTAYLTETCPDLTARAAEITAGIERFKKTYPTIPDAEVQSKASDFAGGKGAIASFLKLAEARRVAEKQPFIDGGNAVQGFFKKLVADIEAGRDLIRARMTDFAIKLEAAQREAAKREAEAAAERAKAAAAEAAETMEPAKLDQAADLARVAERADQHAESKPADHSRVYGQHGTVSSLRETWNFEVSDKLALMRAILAGEAPADCLMVNEIYVRRLVVVEKRREIPGVRIFSERKV